MPFSPTHFNINEQKMLDYYDQLMDQVYLLYHNHPSHLVHIEVTPAEAAEMVEAEGVVRAAGKLVASKKVHLIGDPNRSNGLPRKLWKGGRR